MAFSFEKVNDSLLQVLECPVCLDYMAAPIILCKNGHNICSSCKIKQKNCPICREEFGAVRVLALEKLSEVALFPCENKEAGCEIKLLMADRREHFRTCQYRLYECLAGTGVSCGWKGRKPQLFDHVKFVHPKCLLMPTVPYSAYSSMTTAFTSFQILLGTKDLGVCQLIKTHSELFWFHFKAKVGEEVNMAVQFIGPEDKSREFTYEIKLEAEGKPEKIFYTFPTHKDTESAADIFKSSWCASLAWRFTGLFSEERMFCCSYGIKDCRKTKKNNW